MWVLMDRGGPVMWLILACSVVAGAVFLERMLHLHRAQIRATDFLQGIYNILRRGNIAEAVSICEETPGPVAYIVRAAILAHDQEREVLSQRITQAGASEIPRLERNLNLLLTLAQVTPLLGLLGTVLGMMEALAAMQQNAPLVHSGDLSGGLWQALVSSAAGLAVAIPTYAAHNFLAGRVDSIVLDMERASGEILSFLADRRNRGDAP
jgi:biopolymer transport protein ExbB